MVDRRQTIYPGRPQRREAVAPGPAETGNRRPFLQGAALVVLTLVAYFPALEGSFVWDDDEYVSNNANLRTLPGLLRMWTEPTSTPQYYPLVFSTFWVEYHLWGLQPAGYHFDNVLLHGLNAVLCWLVLRRLNVPGAWVVGAVFALHPVHVESVAWVSERKNDLSTLLYGAALLAYLRFSPPEKEGPVSGGWSWYLLALGLYLGALLSKTVTCSFPAAVLLLLWWKRGKLLRRDLLLLAPFFAAGLAFAFVTVWVERHHVGARGEEWALTGLDRVLVAGRALWFYASKLAYPTELTFIYPRWEIDAAVWWQYLYPAGAAAVILGLWLLRGRLGRGPLAAVLFFAGTLVPALGFFDVYPMRYSFVADHFQYLASAGLLALGVATGVRTLDRLAPRRTWAQPVGAALVLLLLGTQTWLQSRVYADPETLWTDTLRKNPGSWMAHNNLGMVLVRKDEVATAVQHYRDSLALNPRNVEAHYNLGVALTRQRKLPEAAEQYAAALEIKPDYAPAHLNLGWVLLEQGKPAEALPHLRTFLEKNPQSALGYCDVGRALAEQGQPEEALTAYRRAVELEPANPGYHLVLALELQKQGKTDAAEAEFREVSRLDPHWHRERPRGK
jgi:Tfp pilus assembly protein PilF